ncbi:DsbA family oxidoreductase [Marinomonas sp. 15G1-11]|uniref:DsbA family oxidoreductase n=1 Tax=Marinomonas phaeophyticola TaxID=3004091 RepID=A0ABT4JQL1_9GAMM|nr:DsbA family oxidoreductase [Marinomonas sp. 15G1-11]MCZ2720668.1 DsbA family oxidoreductase [Marinomonas sp. 15G1-11]
MTNLKIDIVSDVMCPWCIIGYKNLERALNDIKSDITADISWHPFELNPDMPIEGQDINEHLQEKYGLSEAQGQENRQRIIDMGKQSGFHFDFDGERIMINSFDCHRLLAWAKTQGKQTELKLAMFQAHFSDQALLNQEQQLLDVVGSIGLDTAAAKAILDSDDYAQEVREEESQMQQMGISSVPTFIINNKYAISGGQTSDTFKQALTQISQEIAASA